MAVLSAKITLHGQFVYYRGSVTIAVCPGSFDPITLGHLDVIERSARLFDRVIVGVATNSTKSPMFNLSSRLELARDAVAHLDNVDVMEVPGLLVTFCTEHSVDAIVKGIRGSNDFDSETPMALMNHHLTGIETIFISARPHVAHIASSLVKDVLRFGGDVRDMVTPAVFAAMERTLGPRATDGQTPGTKD